MHLRRLHLPSPGVVALLASALLRVVSFIFHWPFLLVLTTNVLLLLAVVWILVYDLFPIFLPPFYALRQKYGRRQSFFVVLLVLFFAFQSVTFFLPSGNAKDTTTTLAFLSFMAAIGWFIAISLISSFTNVIRDYKKIPRLAERVTVADILTSLAIIVTPTLVLSFFFTPPGLGPSQTTPYQVFVSTLLTDVFMAAYLYLLIIRPRIFTWRQLGLRRVDREDWGRMFVLFVFVVTLIAIMQGVLLRLGAPLQQYSFGTKDGALWALLVAVFVTPFIEELYFRGFLFKGLLLNQSPKVAYITSSLLFAFLHPPVLVMIEVFIIGLLLAYMAKETKSIWPGIAIHALNNAIVFGYLLYR